MSVFLSQADINYLRSQQSILIREFGGEGDIKRPTYTSNGRGGSTVTYTTQVDVPMRIWISSGSSGTFHESKFWGEKENNQIEAFAVLDWDVDIQIKDHITYEGLVWQVTGMQSPDTFRSARRVQLEAMR